MGLLSLNERLGDPDCAEWYEGVFPRDSPRHMRFAINFFTSIGLGGGCAIQVHFQLCRRNACVCPAAGWVRDGAWRQGSPMFSSFSPNSRLSSCFAAAAGSWARGLSFYL